MVAIIKDIFLVDILSRVGEAVERKRVGGYFVFISKVEGGGRGLRLFLSPTEGKGPLIPRATGGRGCVVLKGGVIRVVIEDRDDSRINPGILVVEIVDSLVNNALGFN